MIYVTEVINRKVNKLLATMWDGRISLATWYIKWSNRVVYCNPHLLHSKEVYVLMSISKLDIYNWHNDIYVDDFNMNHLLVIVVA